MVRFFRGMANPRQTRGFRHVNPATKEERLASMRRELERRLQAFGPNDWMVRNQEEAIKKLTEKD
jgi:hypothetical protein